MSSGFRDSYSLGDRRTTLIVAQGPLRVSLLGGGSDLPTFLEFDEGHALGFTIDKRVYVVGHPFWHRSGIRLRYSRSEDVCNASQIEHPIAARVFTNYGINNIDVAVMSDVPAGTGLGSSSAFTVALLSFCRSLVGRESNPLELAEEAIEVEVDQLQEPIGYQDHWLSTLGGLNLLHFPISKEPRTLPRIESILLRKASSEQLSRNLRLIPVGKPRSASALLTDQQTLLQKSTQKRSLTRELSSLAIHGGRIIGDDIDSLGPLLKEAWDLKVDINPHVSNSDVDSLVDLVMHNGATGAKLLGAGASGFVAAYVPDDQARKFNSLKLPELNYTLTTKGAGLLSA